MMAVIALVGALVIGMSAGWLAAAVYTAAAISRCQQRMQRRVRYWQAETARARQAADRLARLRAADRWPHASPEGGLR
jgi:hypothetical protein